jgi:hypothetical protein
MQKKPALQKKPGSSVLKNAADAPVRLNLETAQSTKRNVFCVSSDFRD